MKAFPPEICRMVIRHAAKTGMSFDDALIHLLIEGFKVRNDPQFYDVDKAV